MREVGELIGRGGVKLYVVQEERAEDQSEGLVGGIYPGLVFPAPLFPAPLLSGGRGSKEGGWR